MCTASTWVLVALWTTLQSTLITASYLLIGWRILLQRRHLVGTRLSVSLYILRALATPAWLLWPQRLYLAFVWLAILCAHTQIAHREDSLALKALTALLSLIVAGAIALTVGWTVNDPQPVLVTALFAILLVYLLWWLLHARKRFYRIAIERTEVTSYCGCWCRPLRATVSLWAVLLCGVVYVVVLRATPQRWSSLGSPKDGYSFFMWMLTAHLIIVQ